MRKILALFFLGLSVLCIWGGYKYRHTIYKSAKYAIKYIPRGCAASKNAYNGVLTNKNPAHLKEGRCISEKKKLDLPQKTLAQLSTVSGLVKVSESQTYSLASMTHSKALLTKEGKSTLDKIGKRFQEKLAEKGYQKKKLVVTSMTRSKDSQVALSRGNANAASHSAHLYGSTFDISYTRFYSVSESKGKKPSQAVLVQTLDEVLTELQKEGRLFGLKEFQQPCFHVTASCSFSP